MDDQPFFCGFFCACQNVTLEIFTISDQDENLMIGIIGQRCDGSFYDFTDIGAAFGDYISSYGVQGVLKGIIVQGKGTH